MARWLLGGIGIAAVVTAIVVVAQWPTTTRYGVNFVVFSREMPLYAKVIDFVSRDLQARRLADEIAAGALNDSERVEKIFSWAGQNVRPVPAGFPIVDDHLWNVIVRGYGADDQRTEVFTLLASYSCCRGTFADLRLPEGEAIAVAIVELDDVPRVFVVAHQMMFRSDSGDFASLEDLGRHPTIVETVAGELQPHGVPYVRYFAGIENLRPTYARMERQKPWQRLREEVASVFAGDQ